MSCFPVKRKPCVYYEILSVSFHPVVYPDSPRRNENDTILYAMFALPFAKTLAEAVCSNLTFLRRIGPETRNARRALEYDKILSVISQGDGHLTTVNLHLIHRSFHRLLVNRQQDNNKELYRTLPLYGSRKGDALVTRD